ncbi:L-ascorbate oxidase-like protein [Hordeum vulgare]|nr:L-ascorbate oxidase-like protein [Hordeum vulgare]
MLRLQVHGCGNGTVAVTVEQPGPRLLFLGRGWKIFARADNLWDGHVLHFKMMADNLLSVKIYGSSVRASAAAKRARAGLTTLPCARATRMGRMVATTSMGQILGRPSLGTRI